MKKTYTLFSRETSFYQTNYPGQFAAITTQKTVGRLDCHAEKRVNPENRIFLAYLEDMPEDFRFCKICKPEILRVGDHLGVLENRADALEYKPHVSLWALGIVGENDRYIPCRWYVAMNWKEGMKNQWPPQVTLSATHLYHRAFSLAIKEGKRLNLPVIKHSLDLVILWLPGQESAPEQKKLVEDYQSGDITSIFDSRPIQP